MYEINISGMSCKHCVMTIEEELSSIRGLEIVSVEIGRVVIKTQSFNEELIKNVIEDAGFRVVAIRKM